MSRWRTWDLAPVARNTGFRLVAQGVGLARAAVTTPLIARELGASQYGLYGAAITVAALLYPIAVVGSQGTIVRELSQHPERQDAIVRSAPQMRLLLCALCLPIAALAGAALGGVELGRICLIVSLALVFEALATASTVISARLRDDLTAIAQIAGGATFLGGVVVAAAAGAPLIAYAWLFAAQSLVSASLLWWFSRSLRTPTTGDYSLRRMWREAWPMITACVLAGLSAHADIIIVAGIAGAESAGVLAASARVAALFLALPAAVSASLNPVVSSRTLTSGTALVIRVRRTLAVVAALAVLTCVAGGELVARIFGPGFEEVEVLLPLLAIRSASLYLSMPLDTHLVALGRQRSVMALHALAAVLLAIGVLALTPVAGLPGAAVGAAAAEVVKGILTYLVWKGATSR
jgi:O-antigen/teichoic acid export membrane protein